MRHLLIAISILAFVAIGCTESDPRDIDGGSGSSTNIGGGGSSTGNDGDNDGEDAGNDADADDTDDTGDVPEQCEQEPNSQPVDPRFPCCFDDQDCRDTNLPNADSMHCYYATCTDGGDGSCRVPPSGTHQCWDDHDCPDGYRCPHEQQADAFDCRDPRTIETPATCVEDDSG